MGKVLDQMGAYREGKITLPELVAWLGDFDFKSLPPQEHKGDPERGFMDALDSTPLPDDTSGDVFVGFMKYKFTANERKAVRRAFPARK